VQYIVLSEQSEEDEPGENIEERRRHLHWAPHPGRSRAAIGPRVSKRQGPHSSGLQSCKASCHGLMWQAGVFCLWEGSTQGILVGELVSSASLSPTPVICLRQLQN
jgi:hypothetical protein